MEKKHYQIWKLPFESIIEGDVLKCDRKNNLFKFQEGFFPEVTETLRVRPNAKEFFYRNLLINKSQMYAVLYRTKEKTECLYLFKIVYSSFSGDISEIALCRCIGKHKLKKHNKLINQIVLGNVNIIESLDEKDWCSFIF